jgi:hypothetical protein
MLKHVTYIFDLFSTLRSHLILVALLSKTWFNMKAGVVLLDVFSFPAVTCLRLILS